MATPETAAELDLLEVGIGRPVASSSLSTFLAAFESIMPREVSFLPREIPGVNYVDPGNMSALIRRSSASIEQSQVAPLVTQMAASLSDKGKLRGETARAPVWLNIEKVMFKPVDPSARYRRLQINLYDREELFYPTGYLVEGEKSVTRQTLGLEPKSTGRKRTSVSKSLVKLGVVSGEHGLVTTKLLNRLGAMLEGQVELDPVGIIAC